MMFRSAALSLSPLLILQAITNAETCDPGDEYAYNSDNGHYYKLYESWSTWPEAKSKAEMMTLCGIKGHLVTITSQTESDFVASTSNGRRSWIGLFQPEEAVEPDGSWMWVTGEVLEYTNWPEGEPNDRGNEDYAAINWDWDGVPGKWNDIGSSWQIFYVVEFDVQAICKDVVTSVNMEFSVDDGSDGIDSESITITQSDLAFDAAGIYSVELTVTDTQGATATCNAQVVVYDPSEGFVTGGGWIDSPAGAYKLNELMDGKASFGFVAKYKKGASIPSGETQFNFQSDELVFHSESYQWLVVNQADQNAQFKGDGCVNGVCGYKFMLWATDAEQDMFRIKIWEEIEEQEVILYDNGGENGENQEIAKGSIIIHTTGGGKNLRA